jgi:hypothetical protein
VNKWANKTVGMKYGGILVEKGSTGTPNVIYYATPFYYG